MDAYASFDDWFGEQEGYAIRAERFDGDGRWLKAAFDAGRSAAWRPISSAPKDGRMILLYNSAHKEQQVMGWSVGFDDDNFPDGCWTDAGSKNKAINAVANGGYFQYWQPLQEPPDEQT